MWLKSAEKAASASGPAASLITPDHGVSDDQP
jgi:hypothetical protein